MSAFVVEIFYNLFGSNDWAFYLLSQIFVITAFFYVWRLSNEIFKEKIFALISLLIVLNPIIVEGKISLIPA